MSSRSRRWPAEWAPHRATWLAWPHNRETWPGAGLIESAEDAFCEMVRAILPGESVEILVPSEARAARVRARLEGAGLRDLSRVGFHVVPTDDAWIRDHGGLVVCEATEGAGERRLMLDFVFDAWGGKYPPWDRDAAVAAQMARVARLPREAIDLVLEGGSIDGDGEGAILTTESCLLNDNRARGGIARSREGLESVLGDRFGARVVLWLEAGLEGDDTDGHVDDVARFVAPGRVVAVIEPNEADPNHAVLEANRRRLEALTDAKGRRLEVTSLPSPPAFDGPHGRAPASYANFYFANAALLVPVFGVETDDEALAIFEGLRLDRPIVPIPARELVQGLGAVHCLTQQEPAPSPR